MAELHVNGVRLHVQRLGRAGALPRVVFVHGLVMDNLSSWYFTVANAAAGVVDVLLYDLRGHGRSERPATRYRVADHVADLAALLDQTWGDEPVCLVGNSFGALLCLAFCRDHPRRVAGLVLVDGHLGTDGFGEAMSATLSLRGDAAHLKIAESFQSWLGRHSERKRSRLAEDARTLVEDTTLVADLRETPTLTSADLEHVTAPVLALYGERSDLITTSLPVLARLPHGHVVVLPGCTHSILWEATEAVRDHIVRFCRERAP